MALAKDILEAVGLAANRARDPLIIPWPSPGHPASFLTFATFSEWRNFVLGLNLRPGIPQIVEAKFERAQKLHILAWIDFDIIKAGELVALTALELGLTDRYGHKVKDKRGDIKFARLLKYMVEQDGLTDDKIPLIRHCGGSAVDQLTGKRKPSLADIRNSLAHGYPFDSFPWAGLLELTRDLIEYAYREFHPST